MLVTHRRSVTGVNPVLHVLVITLKQSMRSHSAVHVPGQRLAEQLPLEQVPQLRVPPQPSEMEPHCAPTAAQVVGVQQAFAVVQICPVGHPPQLRVPPHPSERAPHRPAQAAGAQQVLLAVQIDGEVQVPQLNVPPQPSGIVPQVFPCAAQVVRIPPLETTLPRSSCCTQEVDCPA